MIQRLLTDQLIARLRDPKALVIIGPRQVGKTTLLRNLATEIDLSVLWWNGDEPDIRARLERATSTYLKEQIGHSQLLVIDEAQRVENIGLTIKLIVDNIEGVKVIATGSSSFDLSNKINEPLTGRKWEYFMYPLSTQEMEAYHGVMEEERLLNHRLIYGYYPDVINHSGEERLILTHLAGSYLYKDILTWEQVNKPAQLEKLVQALAFQVGNQVSTNELSQTTGIDNHTVDRYINLLEKAFVLFSLTPFSRNLRNEIKKSRMIYFYDNGIRNAVINQFSPMELRADKGALWENYLMSERRKMMDYNGRYASRYFWRNHAQQEIDYIEEADGQIRAFEFKWSPRARAHFSKSFTNAYSPISTQMIHRENYREFVLPNRKN